MTIEITYSELMFTVGFLVGALYLYIFLYRPMMRLKNSRIDELQERITKRGV